MVKKRRRGEYDFEWKENTDVTSELQLTTVERFLGCLHELFEEAANKNQDQGDDFIYIKSLLIEYLIKASVTTAAKARAKFQLKFHDGTVPQVHLYLPPKRFQLSVKDQNELDKTTSGYEFIDILRVLMDQQLIAKPKNISRKRSVDSQSDTDAKRAKTTVRLKTRHETSVVANENTLSEIRNTIEEVARGSSPNVKGGAEATAEATNERKDAGLNPQNGSLSQTTLGENQDGLTRENEEPATKDAAVQTYNDAEERHDQLNSGLSQAPLMAQLMSSISTITSSDWENLKPELLESLAQLGTDGTEKATAMPANFTDRASERLSFAISKLGEEISQINAESWAKYEKEIGKSLTRSEGFGLTFQERLTKISKICYLEEELDVMIKGDWKRLDSVAKLCAMLAEMTGPGLEVIDRDAVDEWVRGKLRDISWLRKALGTKKRINELEIPRQEEPQAA